MFQYIYTSTETQEFSAADLKKLLLRARLRNHEANVTGILVYHDGNFLQALEGDETAVRAIFSRIEKDPRHAEVRILHSNGSLGKRRLFGDWSMAFADAHDAPLLLNGFIDLKNGVSLSALNETRALEILKACVNDPLQLSA